MFWPAPVGQMLSGNRGATTLCLCTGFTSERVHIKSKENKAARLTGFHTSRLKSCPFGKSGKREGRCQELEHEKNTSVETQTMALTYLEFYLIGIIN